MIAFRTLCLAAVCAAAIAGASFARAHFSGNSWEFLFGSYVIDIGYDADVFTQGSYVRFDFALKDEDTLEQADFSEVWVRVVEGERATQFATGVHRQSLGPTTLLYVFPRAGEYRLEASYRNASGKDIATTSFPIVVEAEPGMKLPWYAVALLGAVAGATAAWLLGALIRKKPHAHGH